MAEHGCATATFCKTLSGLEIGDKAHDNSSIYNNFAGSFWFYVRELKEGEMAKVSVAKIESYEGKEMKPSEAWKQAGIEKVRLIKMATITSGAVGSYKYYTIKGEFEASYIDTKLPAVKVDELMLMESEIEGFFSDANLYGSSLPADGWQWPFPKCSCKDWDSQKWTTGCTCGAMEAEKEYNRKNKR
jgi:hypothetical protein